MSSNNLSTSRRERMDAHARELLDSIADAHAALTRIANEDDPTVTVRVITAVPLDDALREKAHAKAEQLYHAPVLLKERVDPSIIGGIILEAPTHRYDASVRTQLASVKRGFAVTPATEEG